MNASRQVTRQAWRLYRACLVGGALDPERVRKSVEDLAGARPRGYLATLSAFARLVNLDCTRHTAKIESAAPLPAPLQAELLQKLAGAYGPGLSALFAQNPDLIGGVRVQVGSDVFDGSVRGRLAALGRSI